MQKQSQKEFTQTQAIVFKVLEKYPQTRNNDNLLYYLVCRERAKAQKQKIDRMSFFAVMCNDWEWLPKYESVVRFRRLAQKTNEELKPAKPVISGRQKKETDFVELARKGGRINGRK